MSLTDHLAVEQPSKDPVSWCDGCGRLVRVTRAFRQWLCERCIAENTR